MNEDERLLRFSVLRPLCPLHTWCPNGWRGVTDRGFFCVESRGSTEGLHLQTQRVDMNKVGFSSHRYYLHHHLHPTPKWLQAQYASADIFSPVVCRRFTRDRDCFRRRVLLFELWAQLSSAEQGDKETASLMDPAI